MPEDIELTIERGWLDDRQAFVPVGCHVHRREFDQRRTGELVPQEGIDGGGLIALAPLT